MVSQGLARILSVLFHPLLNPVIAFILLGVAAPGLSLPERVAVIGVAILFSSLLPIACSAYLIRAGKVVSPEMEIREQRPLPLVIVAGILLLGFGMLAWMQAPDLVRGLMFCYGTNTLLVALISCWWKISIHAAGIACPLVALTYQFGFIILPFYILIPLVGSARVALKRHTIAQVIAGALLGLVLTAIQLQLFL